MMTERIMVRIKLQEAHMGRTSSQVKDRYNAKAYDEIKLRVPKGQKAAVEAFARSRGLSTNALLNALLREAMDVAQQDWKGAGPAQEAETQAVETKAVEAKVAETKVAETKAVEMQAVETKAVETKSVEPAVECWPGRRLMGKSSGSYIKNAVTGRPDTQGRSRGSGAAPGG